ncbi:MAG: hypothetical protein P0Y50_08880 [Candidatus Brevundimonas colombiensis]|uniref:Uncharacterized protein n=1 Tax=Candidatus Brevundimonas colombiensis TaxID=3121376 RepID=A0AAJ5WUU5_9CAUL|nr:hypothetical protein [Brevundimonas sp.]WEK38666.1 MAG: hypothetical protein P0Y50_08880 [Brevundimonas sp.]
MIRVTVVLACLMLTACATRPAPEPVVRTVDVLVPIATPCRVSVGPAPDYVDSDEALRTAADIFEAMKLRIAGRDQRQAREAVLQAALDGCAGGRP